MRIIILNSVYLYDRIKSESAWSDIQKKVNKVTEINIEHLINT